MTTRLRQEFLQFHKENPWVYTKLADYCERLWKAGWRSYSMRTLIAVIRFDRDLETGGEEVTIEGNPVRVKINDHHASYYARLLAYKRRKFERFFNFRRVQGEEQGVVVLFSDVRGERDRVLGAPPPPPRPKFRFSKKRKKK